MTNDMLNASRIILSESIMISLLCLIQRGTFQTTHTNTIAWSNPKTRTLLEQPLTTLVWAYHHHQKKNIFLLSLKSNKRSSKTSLSKKTGRRKRNLRGSAGSCLKEIPVQNGIINFYRCNYCATCQWNVVSCQMWIIFIHE